MVIQIIQLYINQLYLIINTYITYRSYIIYHDILPIILYISIFNKDII